MNALMYRAFPFIPLMVAAGFITGYSSYATPDAQDGILYIYVIILALLGMLIFTVAGMVYLVKKGKEMRYYKILFIILTIINLFTLLPLALYGIWAVAIVLAIIITGCITLKSYNRNQG